MLLCQRLIQEQKSGAMLRFLFVAVMAVDHQCSALVYG